MAFPRNGEVYQHWVWENRANGRAMEVGMWLDPFPPEMTVGGEGFPTGTAAAAGNSHNRDPKQTLILVLRDAIHGFQFVRVPFKDIQGGYQPVGAAHVLLHRDFEWQDNMLKVVAGDGEKLLRIYTWQYLVRRSFMWSQPDPEQPGKWVEV